MSLTRKLLSALGVSDEAAEQIISAHMETVTPLKQERDNYKLKADQYDEVQKELNETKEKLTEYEESDEAESWKAKHDQIEAENKKLQKAFDDYKADIQSKELTAKKKAAYRELLKEAGITDKRIDMALKMSDYSSIDFDKDGEIKNAEAVTEKIKTDWSDLIAFEQTKGADVPKPPAGDGGSPSGSTRAAEVAKAHYARIYGVGKEE